MNDEAQLHTLESIAAAIFITLTVYIITQSAVVITPQPEMFMDVQLKQTTSDALTVLDMAPDSVVQCNLTQCVASWNLSEGTLGNSSLQVLDQEILQLLPDMAYNVDFAYVENDSLSVKHVIVNGVPREDSVVARRLVTLYNSTVTDAGGAWNITEDELRVVEVRLITWHV